MKLNHLTTYVVDAPEPRSVIIRVACVEYRELCYMNQLCSAVGDRRWLCGFEHRMIIHHSSRTDRRRCWRIRHPWKMLAQVRGTNQK